MALYEVYIDGPYRFLNGLPFRLEIFHILTLLLFRILLFMFPLSRSCLWLTFSYRLILGRLRHDYTFSNGVEIIACLAKWVELLAHFHIGPLL